MAHQHRAREVDELEEAAAETEQRVVAEEGEGARTQHAVPELQHLFLLVDEVYC